jgi:putative phosphoesterase
MLTLGVITDTHLPWRIEALPPRVFEIFRGADRILHAGDINSQRVLDQLAEIAPVDAVAGNADLFRHGLPLTRVIEVEERHIGLVHGHGGWLRYLGSKVRDQFSYAEEHYLKIVQRSFGPVDAIVFGHIHRFYRAERSGILLFNPGPIAPDFYNTPGPQVGLLHVTTRTITSEIAAV